MKKRLRPVILLLLAAAPLALVAGVWLRMTAPLPPEVRLPASRSALEDAARRHAATLGLDAGAVAVRITPEFHDSARIYALRAAAPGVVALLNPGFVIGAGLRAGEISASIRMNPHGQLLGFDLESEELSAPPELTEEVVRAAATRFVDDWLGFAPGLTISPLARAPRGRANRFTFEVLPGDEPRARFSGSILMHGTRPLSAQLRPEFDSAFAARFGKRTALRNTISSITALVTIGLTLYALVLYRRRIREKEAPRSRVRILIIAFALLGGGHIALNFETFANVDAPGETLPWYASVLAAAGGGVLFAAGGFLAGAAYGAGEGQFREGFPGKMTSFDALLAGHSRSRNVGRSVTAGAAAAAWALLAVSLGAMVLGPRSVLLLPGPSIASSLGRLPWVSTVMDLPLGAVFVIVAGLFMPLTFALRHVRPGWRRWAILLTCTWLATGGFNDYNFVDSGQMLEPLIAVAVVLAPFFLVDLLAAITATSLYYFGLQASALAAVAPWMLPGVLAQFTAVTLVLLILGLAWRSGEDVSEEEVKPDYARNLDQRLSMRSEISAAREAQLRLLPAEPPVVAGLSLAASCRPTGDVGADFYDFFPLPDGRLVVFVASGGGLGVASALTIALAKGYLMSDLRRSDPPGATLTRLRGLLTGRLGEVAQRARFALIRIDPGTGLVEAARWGEVPGVWHVSSSNQQAAPLAFSDAAGSLPSTDWHLTPGDALILHTEGLISALEDQSSAGILHWFQRLSAHGAFDAHILHAHLLLQLTRGKERTLQRRLRSDLTTVVLRLEHLSAKRQEAAA